MPSRQCARDIVNVVQKSEYNKGIVGLIAAIAAHT